jgi:hypothetical protein
MHGRLRTYCAAVLLVAFGATGSVAVRAEDAATPKNAYDLTTWRQFWSFKSVRRPSPPEVKDEKWVRNPIDQFILARLEREGLKPSPEADKLTLIRRLTYDLTGLPPTPEEIRAFQQDKSPDAYEKLVERLLASPHYGERWGRHWLDVARYVPGRITFPGMKNTKGDAHYRDYVVRAFNADKPYEQFLTEQLAGDLLPAPPDRVQYLDQVTAPAFLSIGAWFDQETDPNRLRLEMVDEMVNATTQAFLGLTVSCARCHDHKFDPIPDEDYYALGGIFRSTKVMGEVSEFWRDGRTRQLRLRAMPDEVAANEAVEKAIAAKKAERWNYLRDRHAELTMAWKAQEAQYRAAAAKVNRPFVKVIEAENFDGQDNLRIAELMRDGRAIQVLETQTPTAQWAKYVFDVPSTGVYRLEALYSTDEKNPLTVTVNGKTVATDALSEPTGGWELRYQRWHTVVATEMRAGPNYVRINAKEGNFPRLDRLRLSTASPSAEVEIDLLAVSEELHPLVLHNFVLDPAQPWPTIAGITPYVDAAQQDALKQLDAEIERLDATIKPYELYIAVTDQPAPTDLPVHIGGDTYKTSPNPVPRGVLTAFDHALPRPAISSGSSGRLELARWLTDPRHPLTSRVMVNRVWHWHFGRGIVGTTSDFGSRGDPPTHPELLDWLAAEVMEKGWSVKHLHRLILKSSTYRQGSSAADAKAAQIDPENRLLSHFGRRRLEAEAIYDAMRSTTNMIPRQQSGQPLDPEKSKDRAMYILANGRSPKGLGAEVRKMFPLFDYETSGRPLAARACSATPAQSLFFMNNPLVKYMADRFAERLLKMDRLNDEKRLEMAYLLALGRPPAEQMKKQSLAYLEQCEKDEGMSKQDAWSSLCQALYGTAEFRYID